MSALEWNVAAGDLADHSSMVPESYSEVAVGIGSALDLVVRQIAGGAAVLMKDAGKDDIASALQSEYRISSQPDFGPHAFDWMHHLDYAFTFSLSAGSVLIAGDYYHRAVAETRTLSELVSAFPTPFFVGSALIERRARAVRIARLAFRRESRMAGSAFDPRGLAARLFRYIAIGEAAEVIATAMPCPSSEALLAASSALRSAWYLWLEDTHVAMSCVRVLLEQTCRARAWRLRATRAEALEGTPHRATPARWIDLAGWRRAAVLGRALGEFSHLNLRARWEGAMGLLAALQPDATNGPTDHLTARGHALDAAAYMLAHEVATRMSEMDNSIANDFRKRVTLLTEEEHEAELESLLDRGLALRRYDFGSPMMRPLDKDHEGSGAESG